VVNKGKENNTYDLYAVAKHYGVDKSSGHYEAACLDPIDGEWYSYSDTQILGPLESEDKINNRHAYVIYYRRRDDPNWKPREMVYRTPEE